MEASDRVNILADSLGPAVCSNKLQFCHYMKAAVRRPWRAAVGVPGPMPESYSFAEKTPVPW